MGMDRKHSQTPQDEWKAQGWSNPAGFPARCNVFFMSTHSLLKIVQVPGEADDDSSALAEHRTHVYHKAILEILCSVISVAGKKEFAFNDGTVHGCIGQLIISILSMDYEEA